MKEFIEVVNAAGTKILVRIGVIVEVFKHPREIGVTVMNRMDQLSYEVTAPDYDTIKSILLDIPTQATGGSLMNEGQINTGALNYTGPKKV